ncbi:sugar phosphate nucleotidyltransferase, partial [Escherichia coli]|nr:sugar phosphate nucleotidyltransferase [Escherichia coli]
TIPYDKAKSLASMGIYIFDMDVLKEALTEDAKLETSSHDFGNDIIPKLIDTESVYAYKFCGSKGRVDKDCYWRAVGTIDSFYEA